MILNREEGGYARGDVIRLYGGFKYTASGNVVDTIRDGNSKCVASVTRVSAGLYEVTFDTGFPIPERLVTARAWVRQSTTVGKVLFAHVPESTYSQSTRKFRIQTIVVGDVALSAYTDPAAGDPDDQARVEFELIGSISSIGTDPA
jgi:hypothetical protein